LEKQPVLAELRFVARGINLYGTVVRMSAQDIAVRLKSLPVSTEMFAKNTDVELVVLARETMYTAPTQVVASGEGVLRLAFSAPVTAIQRRKEQRVALEQEVTFRSVQGPGCYGPWKTGNCKDISSGGMRLVIAPTLDVPQKLEVLILLSDQSAGSAGSIPGDEAGGGDNRAGALRVPAAGRPIKATARVCNNVRRPDGCLALGLAFTLLSTADQIQLARFLNAPTFAGA
jgi:c-di-GMP-binding flagellar brake protein YcgR